jgi:hypothetical protein
MYPAVVAVAAVLSLNFAGVPFGRAGDAIQNYRSQPVQSRPCGQGYRCQDVHAQLCIKRPHGGSIWSLTRKDAQLRRAVSARDCTEYAVGIGFTLRYNGRQAAVPAHSLRCAVQAQHSLQVVIKTCYHVMQTNSQKRFQDVVTGARVCVRSAGYRGPGCQEDYALNLYAYADGRLTGETFVGFWLRASSL